MSGTMVRVTVGREWKCPIWDVITLPICEYADLTGVVVVVLAIIVIKTRSEFEMEATSHPRCLSYR